MKAKWRGRVLVAVLSVGAAEQGAARCLAQEPYRDPSLDITHRVDDLLRRMSLQEKIGQLEQRHSLPPKGPFSTTPYADEIEHEGVGSITWTIEDPAGRNQLQHLAVEHTRLGIPIVFAMDVIHGYRTVFPISAGLSCSFDPQLFQSLQAIAAREARAAGIDWTFAPMSDLARDPRWGRVAETCGEDPYLTSQCIAAAVRGLQGDDPRGPAGVGPEHVAACLKHFVGYSAAVGGRDYNTTDISEWGLRNFHLPSFHAGVQAGALTLMSSFNAIDGIPMVANHHTLTDILRGEWGFEGMVVSDWEAVAESITWGYAKDDAAAARLSLMAGNDMEMMSHTYAKLRDEIGAGRVPMSRLDDAVRHVLTLKFRLGLFDHPYVDEKAYPAAIVHPQDLQLARGAAAKSAVLLKNQHALPLARQGMKLALIGPFGDDRREMLGCWAGKGNPQDVVTLAAGIRSKLADGAGLEIVKGCEILDHAPRTKTQDDGSNVLDESVTGSESDRGFTDAVAAARRADMVIMALGEPAGWTGENTSRATLGVTGKQQALFDAVVAAGKPVVVIVFSGRPLALPEIAAKAAALVYAWQPGVQAGNGLADLLFGDVGFSGRLTQSVPQAVGQVPVYYNHDVTGRPEYQKYRHMSAAPLFPFGFGLTPGSVRYSDVNIGGAEPGGPAAAVATIRNESDQPVDEVAQLYIHQVACEQGVRPAQELRGFQHVQIAAHASAKVRFALTNSVLGYWQRDGGFATDDGDYQIWIAPHASSGNPASYHRGG